MDVEKSGEIVSDHVTTHKAINGEKEADDLESDEEYDDNVKVDTECISCQQSSLIRDKYKEDMDAPTLANKMADLIIDFECSSTISNKPGHKNSIPDPDDIFYSEDEIFKSDEEEDDENCDEDFDFEELCQWKKFKKD